MLVTLSERKLSERIRELENIQDSTEEICERMQHYAARLFKHIAEYGVQMAGMVQHSGGLGVFRFSLSPVFDDEGRSMRIEGLNLMNPNSVSVEVSDLPGLVPQGIARTVLEDEFGTYSHEVQKILPSDISPTLERIAQRVMTAPLSVNFGNAESNEEY